MNIKYFQKTIHNRLVTIGFTKIHIAGIKVCVFATSIQHPVMDKPDKEIGKTIVGNRLKRRKHTDGRWGVVSVLTDKNSPLFTYPVFATMADAFFKSFEERPEQYIAGLKTKKISNA